MTLWVAFAALATGCGSNESSPPAPPATPQQLNALRSQFMQSDPMARLGVVTAVLPSGHLAQVGDVPVADFTTGDIITFLDSKQKVLAMGHVEGIGPGTLTVRYDRQSGGRDPLVGDLAVRAIH